MCIFPYPYLCECVLSGQIITAVFPLPQDPYPQKKHHKTPGLESFGEKKDNFDTS